MYNRIINPLVRRRIKLGYSQTKMSELLNITQSQYSRIEKGDSDPTKHINDNSYRCKLRDFHFKFGLTTREYVRGKGKRKVYKYNSNNF